ncbi:MAG: hypothetical protein AB7F88_19780 [Pyrinomonadaceae bacterium]
MKGKGKEDPKLTQIQKLEKEIFACAWQADMFERYVRRGCGPEHKEAIEIYVGMLDKRIRIAQAEIKAIEGSPDYSLDLPPARKEWPPIVRRQPVKFFGIEVIGNDESKAIAA